MAITMVGKWDPGRTSCIAFECFDILDVVIEIGNISSFSMNAPVKTPFFS